MNSQKSPLLLLVMGLSKQNDNLERLLGCLEGVFDATDKLADSIIMLRDEIAEALVTLENGANIFDQIDNQLSNELSREIRALAQQRINETARVIKEIEECIPRKLAEKS